MNKEPKTNLKTTPRKKSASIDFDAIKKFFSRFHGLIFFLIIAGGLITVVFLLSNTVALSDQPPVDATPSTSSANFDEETIEQIRGLTPSEQQPSAPAQLPNGRNSPF